MFLYYGNYCPYDSRQDLESIQWRNRQQIKEEQKFFDDAISEYKKVVEYKKALAPKAYYRIGECFSKKKDYKNAIDIYDRVIRLYPDSEWASYAIYGISVCLEEEGKIVESIEKLEDGIKKYKNNPIL